MKVSDFIRQPKNLGDKIWRYMDLPKLIYLLEKRKHYLSRADRFEDTHEGATPLTQKKWENENDPQYSDGIADFRRRQREWTFITCWSHREHESHALWRIFCGPKQGVAVRSSYIKLADLMNLKGEDVKIGLVDYGRDDPIPANSLIPFFRKRRAFEYEQEARFVANIYRCIDVHDENGKHKEPLPCLQPSIRDFSAFVEAIRIHPEAEAGYAEAVKSVVSKFSPEIEEKVEPSEMAESPQF